MALTHEQAEQVAAIINAGYRHLQQSGRLYPMTDEMEFTNPGMVMGSDEQGYYVEGCNPSGHLWRIDDPQWLTAAQAGRAALNEYYAERVHEQNQRAYQDALDAMTPEQRQAFDAMKAREREMFGS